MPQFVKHDGHKIELIVTGVAVEAKVPILKFTIKLGNNVRIFTIVRIIRTIQRISKSINIPHAIFRCPNKVSKYRIWTGLPEKVGCSQILKSRINFNRHI